MHMSMTLSFDQLRHTVTASAAANRCRRVRAQTLRHMMNASAAAHRSRRARVQALQGDIAAEQRRAHSENLGIYMQNVPRPEALPRLEGKRMVNPKSPEDELLRRNEEWFHDIVPDKVTRNLSRCRAALLIMFCARALRHVLQAFSLSVDGRVLCTTLEHWIGPERTAHGCDACVRRTVRSQAAARRYTSQMEDVVRGFMAKLEAATDDTRVALAAHGLPAVLDAMNPGHRPELPEVAKAALADDFVQRGLAGQLPSMTDTLRALREQARTPAAAPATALDSV
jgi:BRO1-like domain